MAIIELDPASAADPLHRRIAAAVRRAVGAGGYPTGARLPSARALADQLRVNVNTVLRAYRDLSAEGLLDLHPGRGAIVTGTAESVRLSELADQLLAEAARLGVSRAELIQLLLRRS